MTTSHRTSWIALVCLLALSPAWAGIRAPGKYSGVVLFDRWDACYLYSGIYVMYVSEKVKEGLRPYAGQAMQLDATDVDQPSNPGDGLIRAYEVLGPAPDAAKGWWDAPVAGLSLAVKMRVVEGKPEFCLTVKSSADWPVKVLAESLAPTVLAAAPVTDAWPRPWDGPSYAMVTRYDLNIPNWLAEEHIKSSAPEWPIRGCGRVTSAPVPSSTVLAPGGEMRVAMLFNLPPGQYEFLCGYGGGVHATKCLASNLIPFDIDANRITHAVPVKP